MEGRVDAAMEHLERAASPGGDSETRANGLIWLAAALRIKGDEDRALQVITEASSLSTNADEQVNRVVGVLRGTGE